MEKRKFFNLGKGDELQILVYTSPVFFQEDQTELLSQLFSASSEKHKINFYVHAPEDQKPRAETQLKTFGDKIKWLSKCTETFHLAFCFGGDGTLLWLNQFLRYHGEIPIVVINTGHVGFLTHFTKEDLPDLVKHLEGLLNNTEPVLEYIITSHRKIDCLVSRESGQIIHHSAINEVLIKSPDSYARNFNIYLDGMLYLHLNCDGLVFCSQLGSTAYNSSLNGPIVAPDSNLIVMTAIAPFACNFRPLVVNQGHVLRIELAKNYHDGAVISVDSTESESFKSGDSIVIKIGHSNMELVSKNNPHAWIDKLRKLFKY